jgi:SIR2-like domain
VTAAAISKLAAHVLDVHQHHKDPEKLTIIPAVLIAAGTGASDVDALRLALRDADGETIEARDNAAGTRGVLVDDLKQLVDETLGAHSREDLVVDEKGDAVLASTTDGVTAATASEGQRELFGVLASLFDARLHGSELAALVYDESEFDRPTADMVWSLCAAHIGEVAWANLRTLVIVVRAGSVLPERHFRGQASAACVLNGDALDTRRSPETDSIDVRRISRGSDRLVLFLAAGFSMSSRTDNDQPLALGNELRDRALRRLMHDTAGGDELARRFLRYCKERRTLLPGERHLTEAAFAAGLTLERVLVEELNDPPDALGPTLGEFKTEVEQAHARPGVAIEALRDLLAKSSRRVVLITVNLDDLVERHCADQVAPIISDDDFKTAAERVHAYWKDGGKSPLLKLHGSLEDPSTVVASVHSVALGLSDAKIAALDAALIAPDSRTAVCYIGSSMRDRDLNQLLGLRRYAERLEEWWIAPTIADSVRQFIETYRYRRWQVGGVESEAEAHCITLIADEFLAALEHDA